MMIWRVSYSLDVYLNIEMMGAEEEMKLWVKEFIAEVDRIEAFYMKHCEEYRQEYENLNSRYILKKNDKDDLPNTNVNSNNMI
jgi:hypothetical protein